MASTKPKKTGKKNSQKTKTTVKSAKTEKPVAKPNTKKVEKEETKPVEVVAEKTAKKVKFFDKKCDTSENILTVFKSKKIWAAVLGEVLGSLLITMVLLTLGVYQPLYILFVIIAATVAVYKLSGAHLNPIVTVGMMATRRVSAIRGILYIIAQIVGAWLALIIVNLFHMAGGESASDLPAMTEIADGMFWTTAMIEFLGATIIGFFFARAQQFKRSTFTFAAVVGGGMMIAIVVAYLMSYQFFALTNNFILNPAAALMYQILPSTADGIGQLLGSVAIALLSYVIFPMIGGVIGFFISDGASVLNEENLE